MRTRVIVIPILLGVVALIVQERITGSYTAAGLVTSPDQWTVRETNDVLIEEWIHCGLQIRSRHWETSDGESVIMELADNIELGTHVEGGEELMTIWNPWAGLQCKTADARLAAEQSELARLEAVIRDEELAIHTATVNVAHLEKEKYELAFTRASSLYAADLTSREDYETAQFNYQSACADLEKAQAEYDLACIGTPDEIRNTQRAEIYVCKMELQEASVRAETTIIISPFDGIIARPEPGIILCVQRTDTVMVYVPVEQNHIQKILIGASVEIEGPGKIRAYGTVTQIGNTAQAIGDRIAISVVVMVGNPHGRLKPGMTVNAKIEV